MVKFKINKLWFADDTTQVYDAEEKLCSLASEFSGLCERIIL